MKVSITPQQIEARSASRDVLSVLREWLMAKQIPTNHSEVYRRQQLSGARAMPLSTFLAALHEVKARKGVPALKCVVDALLQPFGLRSVSLNSTAPKGVLQEQLEQSVACGEFVSAVKDCLDGGRTVQETTRLMLLRQKAINEIDDVTEAVLLQFPEQSEVRH